MIIHNVQQNTEAWKKLRMRKFTSSSFGDLFMKKTTAGYQNAINKVVFERLTGETPESFSNKWTDRGHELEPIAREAYELRTFNKVHEIGFVELDEWTGASPDGFVGDTGGVQIKCPIYTTIISYRLNGDIPSEYMYQMQGELLVTGRQWIDFFCFHPKLKSIIKRVNRDEKMISEIQEKLNEAIEEATKRISIIQKG